MGVFVMKMVLKLSCLLLIILSLAGCLQVDSVVKVNSDGSGTLEEKVLMSNDLVQQMEAMMGQMMKGLLGNGGGGQLEKQENKMSKQLFDVFDEEKLRKRVSDYGQGVTFVSSEKITNERFNGYKAIYAFNDVNELRINQNPGDKMPSSPSNGGMGMEKKSEFVRFQFLKDKDVASLIINMPGDNGGLNDFDPSSVDDSKVDNPQVKSSDSGAMPAQMEEMFKDLKISMSV